MGVFSRPVALPAEEALPAPRITDAHGPHISTQDKLTLASPKAVFPVCPFSEQTTAQPSCDFITKNSTRQLQTSPWLRHAFFRMGS